MYEKVPYELTVDEAWMVFQIIHSINQMFFMKSKSSDLSIL